MHKFRFQAKRILFSTLLTCCMIMGGIATGEAIPSYASTTDIKSGDVNSDGVVNSKDYSLLKRYLLGTIDENSINTVNADLNGDGRINSTDYSLLRRYLLGIIQTSPSPSITPVPTPTPKPTDSEKILIPHKSWTCGMPDGIPKPESGILVMEADLKLDQVYNLGKTQYGQRQVFIVKSGTITSSKINASIMTGGLDFQLDLSNGAMEIEQILMLKTGDGNYIYLRSAGTSADGNDIRMVPDFEAPGSGSYSWLNSGKYAGRRIVDLAAKTMKISVYDVSGISVKPDSTNSVAVSEPSDVQDQPWDYRKASSEKNGSQFITESVSLGASQSVSNSKRGSRNIIPITGGTVTGSINAKILSAGADYQNLSSPMTIDARYLWQTDDGEVIIVRNAGPFGSLVPTFEVRADSKYSYLNSTLYLSSNPSTGSGGVTITFYKSTK